MSESFAKGRSTAQALGDAFDRSFAEAAAIRPATVSLLAIRIGGDPYALRLDEVAGLHRDRIIAPAASSLPELLGMAGFRGVVAPVYDLGVLLGYPRAKLPRWLAVAQGRAPVALAFEVFEAHLHVELDKLSRDDASKARPHLDGAVHAPDGLRALIRIASIVEAIVFRARSGGPAKER